MILDKERREKGGYDKRIKSNVDIIHLSDLHFGHCHRYVGDSPYDTLLSKILDDISGLKNKYKINPVLVVITGDLAETSDKSEYSEVKKFLNGLLEGLSLEASNVVIVPGNHDVNWDMFKSSELCHKALKKPFEPPYFDKFRIFKEFYDDFYGGRYIFSEKLYNIFPYHELGLVIAGMNSCFKETAEQHFGWIGLEQVHSAGTEIDKIDPRRKSLRIAAFHHNFFGKSQNNEENLADADLIRKALGQYKFSILMHGHRHIATIQQTYFPDSIAHTIISTGSAGLDHSALPDNPNQYQVLRISSKSITSTMRQYSSQSIGGTGLGRWVPDASIHDDGLVRVSRNLRLW